MTYLLSIYYTPITLTVSVGYWKYRTSYEFENDSSLLDGDRHGGVGPVCQRRDQIAIEPLGGELGLE